MFRIGQEEINAVTNAISEKCFFKVNDNCQYVKQAEVVVTLALMLCIMHLNTRMADKEASCFAI